MMPSQTTHPAMSPVVRNVRSLANCQNEQKGGPSGNSQLPATKRHVSVPAVERDSSHGWSSVASTIQGQNSTPSSSLHNSRIAVITPSATQLQSMISTTAMLGTSSRNTPAPSETSQTDSTRRVVSSPACGIASTPTPPSGLENLPTRIPDPEACAIIPYLVQTQAIERNQRQRQWQLQMQAVSTPRSVVSGSRSIHQVGHSNMTRLVFPTGRLMELYIWNRRPIMSASEVETVSYPTRHVAKSLAEAQHW